MNEVIREFIKATACLFHRWIPYIDAKDGWVFYYCTWHKEWIWKTKIKNKMVEAPSKETYE